MKNVLTNIEYLYGLTKLFKGYIFCTETTLYTEMLNQGKLNEQIAFRSNFINFSLIETYF